MSAGSGLRPVIFSLLLTILSVVLLLGGFALAHLDMAGVRPPATSVAMLSPSPTFFLPTMTGTPSPLSTETTETPFPAPPATETAAPLTPTPSSPLLPVCQPPAGWTVYIVRPGDTLYRLGLRTGVAALVLAEANCLSTLTIYAGQRLYLPPSLYLTPTPRIEPCGPFPGWVVYIVQPGDTLYSLARRFGTTQEAIRRANCLNSYKIYVGQALYLPPLPPTPVLTAVPTPEPTVTPTTGPTLPPTAPPGVTPSPTMPPTETAVPTTEPATPTEPADTATPTPPDTPTATPWPEPSDTPIPTPTEPVSPTPASTPTAMPSPTPSSLDQDLPTSPPTPAAGDLVAATW
ncbi:MAG: LysM peptidoglycan-binding domain-containing protein [Anaerolineae bacterium]|nr:LysM peptidoglycan-binding domain-containing protein [Anaerolineae bacterium]